jgi:hypothetical protein
MTSPIPGVFTVSNDNNEGCNVVVMIYVSVISYKKEKIELI